MRRAGDVIPEVLGAVVAERPEGTEPWVFPTECPCPVRSTLVRPEGEAEHRCIHPECPIQRQGAIEHFASRGALDIDALGEKRIRQLIDAGMVASVADLYDLDWDEVETLERMGALSAANLRASIDASAPGRWPGCSWGSTSATSARRGPRRWPRPSATSTGSWRRRSRRWPRPTGWARSSPSRCTPGSSDPANRELVERLRAAGLNFEAPKGDNQPKVLAGMSVVVTGTLEGFSREEAEAAIKARGGKSPGSVSEEDDGRGGGRGPGASKVTKAEELGVPVLDEAGFRQLLETGELPG